MRGKRGVKERPEVWGVVFVSLPTVGECWPGTALSPLSSAGLPDQLCVSGGRGEVERLEGTFPGCGTRGGRMTGRA